MTSSVRLTVLNSMLATDLAASFARHAELGLRDLDLKDEVLGKDVLDLTDGEAEHVARLARDHGLRVYCLSTQLFYTDLAHGEEHFRRDHLDRVPRALEIARILDATMIRLLACRAPDRPAGSELGTWLDTTAPWAIEAYRDAVRAIRAAGHQATIENEVGGCVLASPADVRAFFAALGPDCGAHFTWDIQNLWSMGTPPSLKVYAELKPLIGYVHLKGGQAAEDGALRWRSSLREASWPVAEITARVVADGVSSVICLNPSHGAPRPDDGGGGTVEDDIAFVRELAVGVA